MKTEHHRVPAPARLYQPQSPACVVYLHGGGWTIGSVDTHDAACRRLAAGTGLAVLSVDYRLAPEHPYPAAFDDALGAAEWALGRYPSVSVAGDSAGGTLAALVALRLRGRLAGQFLCYPNTDLTLSQPSIALTGCDLSAADLEWFAGNWVPDPALRSSPEVSPLFAADLAGLPPSLVVTAEHDPLRDEGELYAARLASAGVRTIARREPGLQHGYLTTDAPECFAAAGRFHADVRALLGLTTPGS